MEQSVEGGMTDKEDAEGVSYTARD